MNVASTLSELEIDRESFRVIGLLPLVCVAWADGTVQRAERSLIRRIAKDKGWLAGNGEAILEKWLAAPPSAEHAEKGLALLREMVVQKRGVGASIAVESLGELLVLCKEVAETAGGAWGFGQAIDEREERALEAVADALGIAGTDGWGALVAEAEGRPRTVAPGPKGHLLVGSLPELMSDALGLLLRCARDYGDITRLRLPGVETFLITRPEHIQHVVLDNGRNYVRGKSFDPFRPLLGESILTTSGEAWRRFRRLAQPAFHQRAIVSMTAVMGTCASELCDAWSERAGVPFDVATEMHALTLRIIGHVLLGIDLQGGDSRQFSEAVATGLEYANVQMNPFRIPDAVPTPKNLRYKRAIQFFDDTIYRMIDERRAAAVERPDLMGMLLSARDEETGEGLSDEHIRNEVLTYLVAGHETTATTLTWLFYLLSKHPGEARRLDAEHAEILDGRAPTAEEAGKLAHTARAIDETLRLYPAAFLTSREAVAEDRIAGCKVPPGAWVLMSPYVTHRLPALWANPEGFDPDRFLPDAVAARHNCAYFPFFAGPHKCIGQALSLLEMKVVLAVIRQRVHLDLCPGFEPVPDAKITLRAKNGLHMVATPA
jgi:cytochrome P450